MYMNMKEKIPLMVGLGLPGLFIIGVALFVLFPSSGSLPKISFVYATHPANFYELQDSIIIVNGKISVSNRYGNSIFKECDPYMTGTSYDQNGRAIAVDISKRPVFCDTTLPEATDKRLEKVFSMGLKIFEHDPIRNESRELTVDDVLRLTLDDTKESRDGFEFTYGRNSGDFYGFNNNYSQDYYLKNNRYATKMKLVIPASSQYGSGVQFVGWVR
jgi:hypothetical protein